MKSKILKQALADFKADERTTVTAAGTLTKLVNDYCRNGGFKAYLEEHRLEAGKYLPGSQAGRPTRWRASAAGRCPQQQAYEVLLKEVGGVPEAILAQEYAWLQIEPPMKATQRRALDNGTFTHVRYHMMFDALQERGLVETVMAEEMWFDMGFNLSGTIDRIVRFDFDSGSVQILLDFKTIRSKYFAELLHVTDEHDKQISAYFLLGFPCDWGMVLYEDKDTQAITIHDVPKSDIQMQRLKDQYKLMNEWVQQMQAGTKLSQRVKVPIITDWCSRCPFKKMCDVEHPEKSVDLLEGLPGDDVF